MATGFRVLGYADLSEAHSFIRDCEAEGNEGVSPETYGTRTATGVIRAELPIQHRGRGYLTEDDLIAAIDSGVSAEEFGAEELDLDAEDDDVEDADDQDEPSDGSDFVPAVTSGHDDDRFPAAVQPGPVPETASDAPADRLQDLPARIGSRRELARLGIDLFESRMDARRNNGTHHNSWKSRAAVKQYLRHIRRLNGR